MSTSMGHPSARGPLKLGMVGGGRDAFIGAVHRLAAQLDASFVLTAGALSSSPEKALASARLDNLVSWRMVTPDAEWLEVERVGHNLGKIHDADQAVFRVCRYAADGRKLIDGIAGMWCCNAGHGRDPIVAAIKTTLQELSEGKKAGGKRPSSPVGVGADPVGDGAGIRRPAPSWRGVLSRRSSRAALSGAY